jgi:hypothetical protein
MAKRAVRARKENPDFAIVLCEVFARIYAKAIDCSGENIRMLH